MPAPLSPRPPALRRLVTALVALLAAAAVSVASLSFLAACKSAGH